MKHLSHFKSKHMKHIFIFLLSISVLTSCKKGTKEANAVIEEGLEKTQILQDGIKQLSGEFIYYADAAVLQTGSEVYGVKIDDKMHELFKLGTPFRKEAIDGVKAVIRGKIIPLPEGQEGWPFSVQIKEIISVDALGDKANEVVKIGS